jgi:hypothetical protein
MGSPTGMPGTVAVAASIPLRTDSSFSSNSGSIRQGPRTGFSDRTIVRPFWSNSLLTTASRSSAYATRSLPSSSSMVQLSRAHQAAISANGAHPFCRLRQCSTILRRLGLSSLQCRECRSVIPPLHRRPAKRGQRPGYGSRVRPVSVAAIIVKLPGYINQRTTLFTWTQLHAKPKRRARKCVPGRNRVSDRCQRHRGACQAGAPAAYRRRYCQNRARRAS